MNKISIAYPDTWLTISISVKNRDTWVEAFSGTMTEVGTTREYKYDFTEVVDTDYVYIATCTGYSNMSGTLYSSSSNGWLTTAEHDQLFAIWRSMWGGSGFSEIFKSNLASTRNEIIRKIEDKTTDIESKINETNSHINIAKDDVITTIEAIDIPKSVNEEKEAKKAIKLLTTLDKKVSSYIDSEMSDKEEITKAIQKADSEHEQNIIEALNSL